MGCNPAGFLTVPRIRQLLLLGLLAAIVGVVLTDRWASRLRADHDAIAEQLRVAEAALAQDAGLIVEERATSARLRAESALLAEQIVELERRVGTRVVPVAVERWKTREIAIPCPSPDGPPPISADLRSGWQLVDLRGAETEVVSLAGNSFVVGQVEIWRLDPPPESRLAVTPIEWQTRVRLDSAPPAALPADRRPRRLGWGFGGRVEYDVGWRIGPVVALPPVRVLGVQCEPLADVTVGSGNVAVSVAIVWRF